MNPVLERLSAGRLTWLPEEGCGYYECKAPEVYDQAYFDRYAAQADTVTGRALMTARADLVRRYAGPDPMAIGRLVDVGIGSGAFVELMAAQGVNALGYDVNPAGVAWLEAREAYVDLYRQGPWETVTFWDALEHIREPDKALARCAGWAFVALPIFRDCAHVLASKHYRKTEHYWYFERRGFVRFAESCGMKVVDIVATETALGREEIETFVLRRKA
ncbi:class I SAM-dependent methyltransferase [Phenylobacterium sp.]|uniref:class I SAM-dependent methyltransferase n=1 Tax=Phenylobacterium sp. TaxID=1871053 RepID=UPI00395568D8